MQFEINSPLSEAQWQAVDEAGLAILERTGLRVEHDEILAVLSEHGGVNVDGDRVRLEPELVRQQAAAVQGTQAYDAPVMAGAYSHNYMEPDTGTIRTSTLEDLVLSIRQIEALGMAGCAPVVPLDIPGPKQELVMERITHENSSCSFGGGQATSVPAAEAALEMGAVVGRPCELEIWINSPLTLDPTGLGIIWQLRDRRPPIRCANMPARGMSGPMTLAGLLAQSAAECMGTVAVLRLLDISSAVTYRIDAFWAFPVDMRTGNVLLSGPDYLRLLVLCMCQARRHGVKSPMGKALLTSAKQPDAQAAAEKTAQALASTWVGNPGTFVAAGALSVVEIYSPIQTVIDREIMSWAASCGRPVDFDEGEFLLDEIDEVGPGGTFLDLESTASRIRGASWDASLFSMNSYPTWAAAGGVSLADQARQILDELKLAEGPLVSADQQKELAAIEQRFAAML